MTSKTSAVVACVALTVLTGYAQAPQVGRGGRGQSPAATATPANDAKKVIETMQDNLGMLRGMQRNDYASCTRPHSRCDSRIWLPSSILRRFAAD